MLMVVYADIFEVAVLNRFLVEIINNCIIIVTYDVPFEALNNRLPNLSAVLFR